MSSTQNEDFDSRPALSRELENLRSSIQKSQLVLFVGEQASVLSARENPRSVCSVDDWWEVIDNGSEQGIERLVNLEQKFVSNLGQSPSRVHNALRNVGNFPFIITVNMDELLERFLWRTGNSGETLRLDQVTKVSRSWPQLRKNLLVKCYGDASYNCQVQPNSRRYMERFCQELETEEVAFMKRVFNERPVLFFGCDGTHPLYANFVAKFVVDAKVKHYMFQQSQQSSLEINGSLHVLKAKLEVWEFVQFLSTGSIQQNIKSGQVYERSYLRTQREEYLLQQLQLEKQASEIAFHTIMITNALSPDEYFEQISRPTIEDIFRNDPFGVFSEERVSRSLIAMKERRDNLRKAIKSGTKVTALFFKHGYEREINKWKEIDRNPSLKATEKKNILLKCKLNISKYAKAILLAKSFMQSGSSLEILIVGDLTPEERSLVDRETFALIRLRGGSDEAICYAETATEGDRKFTVHLININGEEVLNKRKIYERSRGKAWTTDQSLLRLAAAVMKANREIQEKFGTSSYIEKEDLEKLDMMVKISHKVTEKLDEDSSYKSLGEGSFGQVYKAKRKGQPVAVKILRNLDDLRKIKAFDREVETLRQAKHERIVEIIDCIILENQLAIVMEFMSGDNLKKHLAKTPGQGQNEAFTVRFVKDIGSAIAHLHSLSLIHRDVKPENIFLSEDHAIIKLGDFGLARATEGTEQTKTMIGSYRYMAPEVMKRGGHYSAKADVYSFGLCLIEVISGEITFSNVAIHKEVYDLRSAGVNPNIPEIPGEFGNELQIKLTTIIEDCLKPEIQRVKMEQVLAMLKNPVVSHKNKVELFCIGTGQGTTAVRHGKASSSMMIFYNGKPLLLVDVGIGVIFACIEKLVPTYGDRFPDCVFITHNHLDHAGEFPLLLAIDGKRRYIAGEPKLRVLSGPEVEERLKLHRLHEMLSMYKPDEVADWVTCCQDGAPVYLDSEEKFSLKVHRSLHGEVCYGFVLYFLGEPILGYSADSGLEENLYQFIFQANTVVVDARYKGTKEHAAFKEVEEFVKNCQANPKAVFVTGYGIESEYPEEGIPGVGQLLPDQYVTLWEGSGEELSRN